jgi:O-methyltransferase
LVDFALSNMSVANLVNMADGLMRVGQSDVAAQLYGVALKSARAHLRPAIRVRQGLAQSTSRRAFALHSALLKLEDIGTNVFIGEGLATWEKSLPFLEDERFIELAQKHADLLPVPNWHWNLQTVLWAVRQAKSVEGDFVELGVFRGHTTIFAAEYLEFENWDRRWYLYDTFEGIPADQMDADWEHRNERAYNSETYSFDEVRERFAAFPNIEVIQGRVPDILAEVSPPKIAFLHVDLNNSTAEIQALEALFDRVSPGGVIVFDDYGWTAARAQHDAEARWFAERGLQVLALPTGQGLFVKGG